MPRPKMNPLAKLARRCADLADREADLESQMIEAERERKKLQIELATAISVEYSDELDKCTQITVLARNDMVMEIDFTEWLASNEPMEEKVHFFYQPVTTW